MFYDLGLCVTIAVAGWLALDHLGARSRAGQSRSIGLLGIAAVLWAAGEVAIRGAAGPDELTLGRRIFFAGACSLPLFWFSVGVQAAAPRWWRHRPWLVWVLAAPTVFIYSSLYWDDSARFVSLISSTPEHGPWFLIHTAIAYAALAAGTLYFIRAARVLGRAEPRRLVAIGSGVLFPVLGNVMYLSGALGRFDPSPLLLSAGALLIRYAIIDSGLTLSLPLARHDVVEQLEVGIVVADLRGLVVDSNPAAHALLETDPIGQALDDAERKASRLQNRTVDVQSMPLKTLAGRVGTALVMTDITQSRDVERRLQQAARLDTIGSLTAGIAHEVNNPLAYIRGDLSLLEKFVQMAARPSCRHDLPAALQDLSMEAVDLVSEVQEGVERIANLVERLVTFARDTPSDANASAIDLSVVVRRAATLASVGSGQEAIRVEINEAPPVLGYESDLVQIVLNLLVNAIQASGGSPDITVQCGPHPDGTVIRVLDRGRGIDPDKLEHVFDPYFTTKNTKGRGYGAGLGLSVSDDLALQHGGRLEARNRTDGGAVFTLVLPGYDGGDPEEQSPPA